MDNNQRNSQTANQMRALDVATKFENLKICERNNGRRLKNSSNNENTIKSTAILVVGLEKEPTQIHTLLERSNAEI